MQNNQCSSVWFANKTLLDSLGIEVPANFDELVAAMAIIREKEPDVNPYMTYYYFGFAAPKGAVADIFRGHTDIYFDIADSTWKHPVFP